MEECVFCQILKRQAPAYIVDENDRVIVFLSLENHPLVVPKTHIPNIYSLDEATGAAVIHEAAIIARALKQGLHCDGVYLAQANEPAAGQDVFHFHLHVYPRWHGDGMKVVEPERHVDRVVQVDTRDRIRVALASARSVRTEER